MKHLIIFEDYTFDKPIMNDDNDLFDEIIKELGLNIDRIDRNNYWVKDISSSSEYVFDTWKCNEPLSLMLPVYNGDVKEDKHYIHIRRKSKIIKKILDQPEPDKYTCWIDNDSNLLDVSEYKIKEVFDELELLDKRSRNNSSQKWKDLKKIATFDALQKRADDIVNRNATRYNV